MGEMIILLWRVLEALTFRNNWQHVHPTASFQSPRAGISLESTSNNGKVVWHMNVLVRVCVDHDRDDERVVMVADMRGEGERERPLENRSVTGWSRYCIPSPTCTVHTFLISLRFKLSQRLIFSLSLLIMFLIAPQDLTRYEDFPEGHH